MGGVVACFGEILLRYSPPPPLLIEQTDTFDICCGGAEANVAVGLARLGHQTRMISAVPEHGLGRLALSKLAAHGVDIANVIRGQGRLGTYVFTPAGGVRPGQVIYDRAASVFAETSADGYDLSAALDGATHVHISGVSLAASHNAAEASIALAGLAKERGLTVSYDGNYREALWRAGSRKPLDWIPRLIEHADLVFGNHKDAALLLSREFSGDGSERRREAALAIIEAFPNVRAVASTARHIDSADCHRIVARIDTAGERAESREWIIDGIVDRIGTGDAFAAGVLHRWIGDGEDLQGAVDCGMATMAIKHATWGDFSLATAADVATAIAGTSDVHR